MPSEDADTPASADTTDTGAPDAPRDPDRGDSHAPSPPPDSRWWYWVAALPVYFVLATVVGFAIGVAAVALALTGATTVQHGVWMEMPMGAGAGIGFVLVMLAVMVLASIGMLLSLLFPVAIYLDADAVAATTGDWTPDPMLYGLIGLAGVIAQPLQVPLAVYYLYKRHESEGVP
ncbi:MAG: hypothetical protein ABEH83_07160 [Halobacterium sp.]